MALKDLHIRLPAWMKVRFFNAVPKGQRSMVIRKKIMEIVLEEEMAEDRSEIS